MVNDVLDTNENKVKKVGCKRCRDLGLDGGCPKCGKIKQFIPVSNIQKHGGLMDSDSKVIGSIPSYYVGLSWEKNQLVSSHKEIEGKNKFNIYVEQLCKIHDVFVSGKIPNKSAIIIAPRKFSKQIWANSCIQFGMKSGHKMLPVLSSNVLKRTLALMTERPRNNYLETLGYNFEDIITCDCLFVSIDSGWQRQSAYSLIDEVIGMRSQFDRPTIFISRFSIEEITKADYNKTFNSILDADNSVNRLRYPIVIQYT